MLTNARLTRADLEHCAAWALAGGVPFPAWQLQLPPPVLVSGLECLKYHISSPLSSDLLFSQEQASMLLADPLWMQVDLMWHISSSTTVGSWVRKAGVGSWCERGGGQGRTLLSRAAKIPPAPSLSDMFNIPHPDQNPSTLPQQWWITSTRAWRAQAALKGVG